jgi:hypothetical protein
LRIVNGFIELSRERNLCSRHQAARQRQREASVEDDEQTTSIFARVRESWINAGRVSGMPFADYPFKALTPRQ